MVVSIKYCYSTVLLDSLGDVIGDFADALHLIEVLGGVVRVDHLVLDGYVIAAEDLDRISAGVIEIGNVVNRSLDADLGRLQVQYAAKAFRRRVGQSPASWRGCTDYARRRRLALTKFIGIGRHCCVLAWLLSQIKTL